MPNGMKLENNDKETHKSHSNQWRLNNTLEHPGSLKKLGKILYNCDSFPKLSKSKTKIGLKSLIKETSYSIYDF
jgi:hypothetical protein